MVAGTGFRFRAAGEPVGAGGHRRAGRPVRPQGGQSVRLLRAGHARLPVLELSQRQLLERDPHRSNGLALARLAPVAGGALVLMGQATEADLVADGRFWNTQGWITLHIWRPRCERLATTEKLFAHAFYNSLLVDQSLAMNRRRDDDDDVAQKLELTPDQLAQDGDMTDLYERRSVDSVTGSVADGVRVGKVRASDTVTRIYVCATMWHETQDEIVTFLKSIFYLDQVANTIATNPPKKKNRFPPFD